MKKLKLLSLEPRVLFDAAGAASAVDTHAELVSQVADFHDGQQPDKGAHFADSAALLAAFTDNLAQPSSTDEITPQWNLHAAPVPNAVQVQVREVVVIDTSIRNYQALLDSVNSSAQIIYLDPTQDGMTQVANALKGQREIGAIHILSHGKAGTLALGTSLVNGDNLDQYQSQLTQIGDSLATGGDLFFYGCNVAEGKTGIEFVRQLAHSDPVMGIEEHSANVTKSVFALTDAASVYADKLSASQQLVQGNLTQWAQSDNFLSQAAIPFSATAHTGNWTDNALTLRDSILNGSYSIRLEVGSTADFQLPGMLGAYSAVGSTNQATIYLNSDWLATATPEAIQAVLLEEVGHDFDHRLNGSIDSQGDEGALFSDLARGVTVDTAAMQDLLAENDAGVLVDHGQKIAVEQARQKFDWTTLKGYLNGNSTQLTSVGWPAATVTPVSGTPTYILYKNVSGTGIDVKVNISVTTDITWMLGSPKSDTSPLTGGTTSPSLQININSASVSAFTTITTSFFATGTSTPIAVTGLNFDIYDIDYAQSTSVSAGTNQDYSDQVTIVGKNLSGDNVVNSPDLVITQGQSVSIPARGVTINNNVINDAVKANNTPTSPLANARVSFSTAVTEFSIKYDNLTTPTTGAHALLSGITDPGMQFISFLADFEICDPDINVTDNAYDGTETTIEDNTTVTPTLADGRDFGSVDKDAGSVTRTFTIQNTGKGILNLTGANPVTISGTNASDFTITQPSVSSINGIGSTTFTVTFNPSTIGTKTATISIASDDPDAENIYTFDIKGEGTSGNPPAGADNTITIDEDTPYTVKEADFGFTDTLDSPKNNFVKVIVTSIPATTDGVYKLNGVDVKDGDVISVSDITDNKLVFTPASNKNGTGLGSLGFKVQDDGTSNNTDLSANTLKFNINPVNDAPLGADKTIAIDEDTPYTVTAADFGFSDPNDSPPNTLLNVIVTSIPATTDGVYKLNGVDVKVGDVISVSDITDNKLVFTPASNKNGTGLGSLGFKVQDNGGTANGGADTAINANTLNFNIAAINDAPVAVGNTYSVNEGALLTDKNIITDDDNGATAGGVDYDADSNPLNIKSVNGTLWASLPDSSHLTYTSAVGYKQIATPNGVVYLKQDGTSQYQHNGSETTTDSFTYIINDGTADSDSATVNYTINPVNDAPTGTDKTIDIDEDTPYTVTEADFGFSDVDGNAFKNVIIDNIPLATEGVYQLNGTPITNGQTISVTDINGGKLTFVPAPNKNGTLGSLDFKVQDNGGTANGGVDTAVNANTLKFDIKAVNDAPTSTAISAKTSTDGEVINVNVTSHFTDVDVGDTLTYTATGLPTGLSIDKNTGIISGTVDKNASDQADDNNNTQDYAIQITATDKSNVATSQSFTWTINNIAPAPVEDVKSTDENNPLNANVLDNDSDGNPDSDPLTVTRFTIDTDNNGSQKTFTAGQTATITGVGSLTINADGGYTFVPATNYHGTVPVATYTVDDGNGSTRTALLKITVNPVNDAPLGADKTIDIDEDTPYTVTAADFGFSDLNDSPPNTLLNVIITSVPDPTTEGVYTLDGTTLTGSETITVADIMLGKLVFTPASNKNGNGLGSLGFKVQDNGGTANGGVDTAVNANTLSFNIAAINDAPVAKNDSNKTDEGVTLTVDAANGLIKSERDAAGVDTDVDKDNLTITQFSLTNSSGTLFTQSIIAGSFATLDNSKWGEIKIYSDGRYTYTPYSSNPDFHGDLPVVTYTLSDGNKTTTAELRITVESVNDAPVFANLDGTGTPPFTQKSTAVILDSNVKISDKDLDPLETATGNYDKTTLTLQRNGGLPNSGDVFSSAVFSGSNIVIGGKTIGAVTTNSAGTLVLTFNEEATTALVNQAMQAIAYKNEEPNPANSVKIDWTFNDQNSDTPSNGQDQGKGGALTAVGQTTVTIITNKPPVVDLDTTVLTGGGDNNNIATFKEEDGNAVSFVKDTGGTPVTDDGTTIAVVKISIPTAHVQDAGAEKLVIGTTAIALNFADGASIPNVTLAGVTYKVTAKVDSGEGTSTLEFANSTTGDPVSITEANALLNALQYKNTSDNPTTTVDRVFTVQVTDGDTINPHDSEPVTFTVKVESNNNPPVVDLDGTSTAPLDNAVTFTEMTGADTGANAQYFTKGATNLTDVDSLQLSTLTVGIPTSSVATGDQLKLDSTRIDLDIDLTKTGTVTYNGTDFSYAITESGGNRIITFSSLDAGGIASPADKASFEALLDALQFNNTSDTPSGSREFSVNVTDSAGLAATTAAKFNVTIAPTAEPPTIVLTDNNSSTAGQESVVENESLTGKTFVITARDGLQSLKVANTTILASDLTNSATNPIKVTTAQGEITIKGYDSTTGVVTYDYYDPAGTSKSNHAAPVVDNITLTVTDKSGSNTPATATLGIAITDTQPKAVDDSNTINRGAATVTGNVITGTTVAGTPNGKDTESADTPTTVIGVIKGTPTSASGSVDTAVAGSYGSLKIDALGNYTYTLDNTNSEILNLATGQTRTETFTYTIADSDGSPSTAQVTIEIKGVTNNAPVISFDPNNSGGGDNNQGFEVSFTKGSSAVNVTDIDPNVTDVDNGAMKSLTLTAAGIKNGADEVFIINNVSFPQNADKTTTVVLSGAVSLDIQYTAATGVFVITNNNSAADIPNDVLGYVLKNIKYQNTSTTPTAGNRTLSAVTTDGILSSNTAVSTITVIVPNSPPVAKPDVNSVVHGQSITGSVIGNDSDPDGDSLTVTTTPTKAPSHGSVTLNSNGSYTYVNTNPSATSDSFEYEVSDGKGGTAKATVTINITNTAPVANSDSGSVVKGGSFTGTSVLANDSDADKDSLSLNPALVTKPTHGTVTLNTDGTYSYTHNGNNATTDSFVYEITDGHGGKAQATVTIGITPPVVIPNTPPKAVGDATTVTHSGTVNGTTVLANDSDPDGNPLTVKTTPVTAPAHGTVVLNADGSYSYTHNGNSATSDSFVYEVSDGKGGTAQATVTIAIGSANTPPKAVNDTATVAHSGTLNGTTVLANDSDANSDLLTVKTTPVTAPTHGTVVLNADGTYRYTHNGDSATSDSFVYEVSDGKGGTAQATVTIAIGSANTPPKAVNDNGTVIKGGTLNGTTVLANDSDANNDPLTVKTTPVTAPTHGIVVLNADGTYRYTHNGDSATSDSFVYEISDGKGGTAQATVTIAITANTNKPPVAVDDTATVAPKGTLLGSPVIKNDSDPDKDPLTVNTTPVTKPAHGTLVLYSDGSYSYTHNGDSATSDSFVYEVSDGKGGTAQATVTIAIGSANTPPKAMNDNGTVIKGGTLNGTTVLANDSDANNDPLTVKTTPVTAPTHGTVVLNADGTYRYTHNGDSATSDSFVYEVSDGKGGTAQATVTIAITANTNKPPVAVDDTATVAPKGTLLGSPVIKNDSDPDKDPLTVNTIPVTKPAHGTLILYSDGSYRYTHNGDSATSDSFVYEVTDGKGGTAQATVTIAIGSANTPPKAVNDNGTVIKGGTLNGTTVLSNDSDANSDPLTVKTTPVTAPTHGTVVLNADGTYRYTHNGDSATSDSFVYEVTDGKGGTAQATVTIAITANTNKPPVAVDDTATVAPKGTLLGSPVIKNDSDPDKDPLTVNTIPVTKPAHGTLILYSDGSYRYTHNGDSATSDSFVYEVSDGKGGTAQATVTINIGSANTPPKAVDDVLTATVGQAVTIDVLNNDNDLEKNINPATVQIVGTAGAGQPLVVPNQGTWLVNPNTGAITFSPQPGFTGNPDPIRYTVQDKTGLTSNPASVTVNYQATAPLANPDTVTGTVGMPIVIDVLGNDVDSENNINPATVQIVGTAGAGQPLVVPNQGTWLVNPNTGAITFSPQPGFTGNPDPIRYTVQDKTGLTSNPASVTVNYQATAPLTRGDVATGTVGMPIVIDVLGNDVDSENNINPATVQIVGTTGAGQPLVVPNQGTWLVNPNTGAITFSPQLGFTGNPDPISYTVQDKTGLTSNPASVTVNYQATAPLTRGDVATGTVGMPIMIDVLGNDVDSENNINPATVQIVGTTGVGQPLVVPNQGTWLVNPNTGAITFSPESGFTGNPDPISYTVQDSTGLTSNPASVTVNYPATAPLTRGDVATGTVGMPIVIDVLGNDVDSENNINPATVQIVGTAGAGQPLVVPNQGTWLVNPNTGAITFNPQPGFTGNPDPISYTVQDKTGLTSNPASVTVNYQNTAPITKADVVTGTVGMPIVIDVLGNDVDSENNINPATVQIVGTTGAGHPLVVPNQGTWLVNPNTGAITFSPQLGFTGNPDPISYTVQDKTGLTSNPASVTVNYQNTAPITKADVVTGTVGMPIVIDVLGNDVDSENNINPATVQIVGTTGAGHPLVVPNQGTWSVNPNTGAITFSPESGFTGNPDPISYTVQDKTGLTSNPASVTVNYQATAPLTRGDVATGTVGMPIVIDVLGNDADSENNINPATVQIVGTAGAGQPLVVPNQGTWLVNPNTGAITFSPQPGFTGNPDPISYTVQDKTGLTSQPASVTVNYPATAPLTRGDVATGTVGMPIVIDVLGNDVDSENNINPATVQIVGTTGVGQPLVVPNQGTWLVNPNTGAITFSPQLGFTGNPDPISYTVQDKTGLTSNPAAVTVIYPPIPIIATNDVVTGTKGQPVTVNVLGNDAVFGASSIQILGTTHAGQSLVVPNQGVWNIDASTGSITFNPQVGFDSEPAPIAYTVQNALGIMSNPATVTVQYPLPNLYNASQLGEVSLVFSYGNAHHIEKVFLRNMDIVPYTYELSPLYEVKFLSIWDPKLNPISLAGELKDQFATNGVLLYSIADKFKHTDPSVPLKFEAALPNGKALPAFVAFDGKTGEFRFNADLAKAQQVKSILIRVVAEDSRGNQTSASFQTRFNQDGSYKTRDLSTVDYRTSELNPLRLVGMLEHQFVLKGIGRYEIGGAFEHTNPNEKLIFTASQHDGSALPNFVRFDAETKSFSFDSEEAHQRNVKKLIIKVVVKDSHNNSVSSSFEVDFNQSKETDALMQQLLNEKFVQADLAGFAIEQGNDAEGFMSLIEALFDNAMQDQDTTKTDNTPATTDANHARHNLTEQVKTAGFFGYQQNKTQLVADLSQMFTKS